MKCISTKILVLPVTKDEEKKNDLGLILPSTLESEGLERALVMYVGNEVTTEMNVGDEVYIYKGSGKVFTSPEDEQKYRVIAVSDIVVIL